MSAVDTDDSWYQRMADRSRQRAAKVKAEEQRREDEERAAAVAALTELVGGDLDGYLRGWPYRGGGTILMGTSVTCIGCGTSLGVTCVIFEEGYEAPPEPDWRYVWHDCPICAEYRVPAWEYGTASEH